MLSIWPRSCLLREQGASARSASAGAFPRVDPGWSHRRRPGRHIAVFSQTHAHQQLTWGHFHSAPPAKFSHKQAKPGGGAGTMALYGPPVRPSLCNGHSCAIAHVLLTSLGCCEHVLNTTSPWRGRNTSACCRPQQKNTTEGWEWLTRRHFRLHK